MTPTSTPDLDYFPARIGQKLQGGRYEILRRLGGGVYSSTYLLKDSLTASVVSPVGAESFTEASYDLRFQSKYLAAKVLTLEATKQSHDGVMQELEFLKKIASCGDINSLPILRDNFEIQGPRGSHLCFVMDLLSTDVSAYRRSAPKKALPPHTVKAIVIQVLEALTQLHELGIIHTDLKLDNILFNSITTDEHIDQYLEANPVVIDGEYDLDGQSYPILHSQPIQHAFSWDVPPLTAEVMNFTLVDLGQGQWTGRQPTTNMFSAYSLRAPELILQSDFGPKIDIWALGCVTFEMLTGRWLFTPEEGEDWRLEDDHLAKMMELTGERFTSSMLERAFRRDEYFDTNGNLLRIDGLQPMPLEAALANYKIVPEGEIGAAASFMRACLRLDVNNRAAAADLSMYPWLRTASCEHYHSAT